MIRRCLRILTIHLITGEMMMTRDHQVPAKTWMINLEYYFAYFIFVFLIMYFF